MNSLELKLNSDPFDVSPYKTVPPKGWYPYADNGGSSIAITGKDYAIVASDTRLSEGFLIYTREQSKVFKLTNKTFLSSTGCWCDVLSFVNLLQTRIKLYSYEHRGILSTAAIAQLVSNILYHKRFFPYYVSNMIVGLDENGAGVVYGYDPVGHSTKTKYLATGSSTALIQPFLDNQVGKQNQANPNKEEISLDTALGIVKDCFISASERDIYCGDSAHIVTITKDGFKEEIFPLRKD